MSKCVILWILQRDLAFQTLESAAVSQVVSHYSSWAAPKTRWPSFLSAFKTSVRSHHFENRPWTHNTTENNEPALLSVLNVFHKSLKSELVTTSKILQYSFHLIFISQVFFHLIISCERAWIALRLLYNDHLHLRGENWCVVLFMEDNHSRGNNLYFTTAAATFGIGPVNCLS